MISLVVRNAVIEIAICYCLQSMLYNEYNRLAVTGCIIRNAVIITTELAITMCLLTAGILLWSTCLQLYMCYTADVANSLDKN